MVSRLFEFLFSFNILLPGKRRCLIVEDDFMDGTESRVIVFATHWLIESELSISWKLHSLRFFMFGPGQCSHANIIIQANDRKLSYITACSLSTGNITCTY